jgi:hypothetical protein
MHITILRGTEGPKKKLRDNLCVNMKTVIEVMGKIKYFDIHI